MAASSSELDRADEWITKLAATGRFEITSSWVSDIRKYNYNPNAGTRAERKQRADDCQSGVENTDVLWILMPVDSSMGAFWEFGFATAYQIKTCISGPNQEASSFTEKASYQFDTDERAFAFLSDVTMRQLYSEAD